MERTEPELEAAAAVGLLAGWWAEPCAEDFQAWLDPERWVVAEAAWASLDLTSPKDDLVAALGSTYETLAEEHQRLFEGPGAHPCPPYESVWRTDRSRLVQGTVMGPAASAVKALYEELGLRVREGSHELPDHLAIELEALACALAEGRPDAARALLHEHLLGWVPGFCERVAAESRHPFYRAVAAITPTLLSAVAGALDAGVR